MDQAELDVAAQQAATVTFQSGADRRRQRADAGDHRDAERQAGDEQPEAAQAAPQLPQRQTQRQHLFGRLRSEEHTSELQSLMRNSYAVFCLKKKTQTHTANS